MATGGNARAGVMPQVAQEPWQYAQREAQINNDLYKMFVEQQYRKEQQADQQRFTLQRDATGYEQGERREARNRDFTREGWDRQDANMRENWDRQDERIAGRAEAKLDRDTIKFGNALVRDLVKNARIPEHAARGMVAEFMAESGDFKQMQELRPLVPGSRGGANLAQWTGPRRIALEQFAAKNGLDPMSRDTGRLFLLEELKGPEGQKLLPQLMRSRDAWEAAQLTRQLYLRPQSIIEGWTDHGRNRRVRSRLFLPEDEPEVQTATSAGAASPTVASNAQAPAQPTTSSGQQQQQAGSAPNAQPRVVQRTIDPRTGKLVFTPG